MYKKCLTTHTKCTGTNTDILPWNVTTYLCKYYEKWAPLYSLLSRKALLRGTIINIRTFWQTLGSTIKNNKSSETTQNISVGWVRKDDVDGHGYHLSDTYFEENV